MSPLHHPVPSKPRHWRTRATPFANVWNETECWLKDEPQLSSAELLLKPEDVHPGKFTEGHRRIQVAGMAYESRQRTGLWNSCG